MLWKHGKNESVGISARNLGLLVFVQGGKLKISEKKVTPPPTA